jgi:hypothetical protein
MGVRTSEPSNSLLFAGRGAGSKAVRCTLVGKRVPSDMVTQHCVSEMLRWGLTGAPGAPGHCIVHMITGIGGKVGAFIKKDQIR